MTGPGSRVSLVCTPPKNIKSREFDVRDSVRSRLRVEPERAVSQPVSRSSVGRQSVSLITTSRCHDMLLESAVSLYIAPY